MEPEISTELGSNPASGISHSESLWLVILTFFREQGRPAGGAQWWHNQMPARSSFDTPGCGPHTLVP